MNAIWGEQKMADEPADGQQTPTPTPTPPPPASYWWDSLIVPGTLVIGLGLFLLFVFQYLQMLPEAQRSTIEGTRLILVLTLIVSMLGFGGLMIARALFGSGDADDLNTRYRLAREVFLVFAGTFGTVTGFYFGSAGTGMAASSPLAVKSSFAGGKVLVTIEGGAAPFVALLAPDGKSASMLQHSGERAISFEVGGNTCPEQAKITVVDGRGQQSETTLACTATTPADTAADNGAAPAAGAGNDNAGNGN